MLAKLKRSLCAHAESVAAFWLQDLHDARLVETNYRCAFGEIDVILEDREGLLFVEVRSLRGQSPDLALASIRQGKQLRLQRTAQHFLTTHPELASLAIRFECVGISYRDDGSIYCKRLPLEWW